MKDDSHILTPNLHSHINPLRSRRMSDEVAAQLQDLIDQGYLRPGDRLPSERELSKLFGVSRTVIREALAFLQRDGLIEVRQGTLAQVRVPNASVAKPFLVGPGGNGRDNILALYEVRLGIESEAAALAARRATAEDIERIYHSLEKLHVYMDTGQPAEAHDQDFHRAVSTASHNAFFPQVMDSVYHRLHEAMRLAHYRDRRLQREPAVIVEEHRQIWKAIKERDPEGARHAMRTHLTNAIRRLLDDSTK